MRSSRVPLALALFAVAFGTNVSTPLLLLYERRLDLSPWTVTALFAVYPLGLAPALAYSGPASDVLGRRRVALPGVVLSAIASLIMAAGSDTLGLLFLGRFLLGAVSGIVFVVASAWMQEIGHANPMWSARLTGLAIYAGFGLGPFLGGILGEWGPAPLVTPYLVHVALVVVGIMAVVRVPETVHAAPRRPIQPNLGIPPGSRSVFARVVAPTALGVFVFPSLAFGLFPVLLRPAMSSIAVFATGLIGILAMSSIIPVQAWVGLVGPYRAAPIGLIVGTIGCGLGTIAFMTDAWPLLFPGAILLGAASGMAMTSGLQFVDLLTTPADRGALTGSFYAVAYAGMTMPLIVATVARSTGFTSALSGLTAVGIAGSLWLFGQAKRARLVGS